LQSPRLSVGKQISEILSYRNSTILTDQDNNDADLGSKGKKEAGIIRETLKGTLKISSYGSPKNNQNETKKGPIQDLVSARGETKKLKNQDIIISLLGLDKFHSERESLKLLLQKSSAFQVKTEQSVPTPKKNIGLSSFTEYNILDRQKNDRIYNK
jgi:hypothetical protein